MGIAVWLVSGGLAVTNVAEAVRLTGASVVDVSSGVEDRYGVKNPDRIRAFLEKRKPAFVATQELESKANPA